ncbi:MAG: sigma-70 family RNA polymerase sigma factor [Chloroflexi bacterium]|nr:sigma-70 family RNA polymerase sigma factor [Chloroflexota bacterium]
MGSSSFARSGWQTMAPALGTRARNAGVAAALRRLPALQRAALVLRYMDGLSVREIAQELNRSDLGGRLAARPGP